jgi:Glycosyltransferase family 87
LSVTPSPSSPGVEPTSANGGQGAPPRTALARLFRAAVWFVAALLVGTVLYLKGGSNPSDFMQFYFAGKLAAAGRISELYHPHTFDPMVEDVRAQGETVLYTYGYRLIRPAFDAFLCIPFSWFSYRNAVRLGLLVNLMLLGLLVWKLPVWFPFQDFFGVDLFRPCLLMFKPFVVAIGEGQDALLLTFFVAAGLRLASQGAEVLAGVVLAFAAIKPQLIWAMPLALLVTRKWKMLASFLVTGAALAVVSLAAIGTTGFREWVEVLRGPQTNYRLDVMANVWAFGVRWGTDIGVIAALLTLVCFGVVLYRRSFADCFAAAILTALLLSPHTYSQDLSLLAIVAVLAAHPVPRYLLVLPWLNFLPHTEVLFPWALLSLAYLVGLALKPQIQKLWRDRYESRPKPVCSGT